MDYGILDLDYHIYIGELSVFFEDDYADYTIDEPRRLQYSYNSIIYNPKFIMKSFKPKAWMLPQPVLIVGTYDADGTPNAMNAAW